MIPIPAVVAIIVVLYFLSAIKILREYERGVIFRLGRLLPNAKGPGIILVFVPVDRMVRISLRQEALEVPPQDIITRDNVTLKVNAVIFLRVLIRTTLWSRSPTTSTRLRNSRRLRFAQSLARRSWTNCWPAGKRSIYACRAFSIRTRPRGV